MSQVLSQDEVNALMQGITNDQAPASEAPNPGEATPVPLKAAAAQSSNEAVPYDFTRAEISSIGRLPGLEVIFSNFARKVQSLFVSELGKSVDASFEKVEVLSYENLIQGFPLPASIHAVRLEPLRGIGIFVIEARLAFAVIELFFGGTGQKTIKLEGRDFTPIETRFLGRFVERLLRGMEESWASVTQLRGRYLRSEVNPYLLNAAGMGDAMICATYTVNMPPISGTILFSLPLAAVEEVREHLKSGMAIGDDREEIGIFRRLQQPLMDIELEVQAVVDVLTMSVREIMALRCGDVIQLNTPGLDQIELRIEGKRKFLGKGAQRNGNKAFVTSQTCR